MSGLDVAPICVVIGRTRHKMVMAEIQAAARDGAGFIEVRLDYLAKAPDFKRLLHHKPCALLATVRRLEDGGRWNDSEEARQTLLRQAIAAGFDWVDLETDVADRIPRYKNVRRIVSYHNMETTPPDLEKIHATLCQQDADVVKIAVRAHSPLDNLRVLALLRDSPKPTVAIAMGDMGVVSRIVGRKLGSPFTYAAFNRERTLAPGLLTFNDLKGVYHYEQINSYTQIYGLLGDPVAHSLSPLIHNSAFRSLGINAVYIPFRIPKADLPLVLKEFDKFPVHGYSVTIPHKEAAAVLARHRDGPVERTQAANTLVRGGDGGFVAYNTDYQGALDSLLEHMTPPAQAAGGASTGIVTESSFLHATPAMPANLAPPATLAGRSVLLLGAGGVARAIAHALHDQQAQVTIANRTADRAQKLAGEVGCRFVEWSTRHSVIADIVVNCTSVGMHPKLDESPLHGSYLHAGLIVFDTVYNPESTLLIKEARARGCSVLTGVDMFVRQAALQFEYFTGKKPPLALMRSMVRQALSPVTLRPEDEDEQKLT